jgi:septum formation protein
MLTAAGVSFEIEPADLDERAIREALTSSEEDVDPLDVAEVLARAKAEAISGRHPDALVIGSDQVLAFGNEIFEKPSDVAQARGMLTRLRGATHQLHSVVALASGGEADWTWSDTAHLTMRPFSIDFLEDYLVSAGPGILESVGAYRLEEIGVQLFEAIEGDYFTILGMPLVPLLGELRSRGCLAS